MQPSFSTDWRRPLAIFVATRLDQTSRRLRRSPDQLRSTTIREGLIQQIWDIRGIVLPITVQRRDPDAARRLHPCTDRSVLADRLAWRTTRTVDPEHASGGTRRPSVPRQASRLFRRH